MIASPFSRYFLPPLVRNILRIGAVELVSEFVIIIGKVRWFLTLDGDCREEEKIFRLRQTANFRPRPKVTSTARWNP